MSLTLIDFIHLVISTTTGRRNLAYTNEISRRAYGSPRNDNFKGRRIVLSAMMVFFLFLFFSFDVSAKVHFIGHDEDTEFNEDGELNSDAGVNIIGDSNSKKPDANSGSLPIQEYICFDPTKGDNPYTKKCSEYLPKVGVGGSCGGYYADCKCPKKYCHTCDASEGPNLIPDMSGDYPTCDGQYPKCKCAAGYTKQCNGKLVGSGDGCSRPKDGSVGCAGGREPTRYNKCACNPVMYDRESCNASTGEVVDDQCTSDVNTRYKCRCAATTAPCFESNTVCNGPTLCNGGCGGTCVCQANCSGKCGGDDDGCGGKCTSPCPDPCDDYIPECPFGHIPTAISSYSGCVGWKICTEDTGLQPDTNPAPLTTCRASDCVKGDCINKKAKCIHPNEDCDLHGKEYDC
jgi:hypothetical protein